MFETLWKGKQMTTVDNNLLSGNNAVWTVGQWLSSGGCLVRPVAADTDIGIDLYCETVENNTPFLHFWVQVKTGDSQIKVQENGEKASFDFKVTHLEYWKRQPVPVFIFLLPTNSGQPNTIYIIDLTVWQINDGVIQKDHTTQRIYSNGHLRVDHQEDASRFCEIQMPYTHVLLSAVQGIYRPIPKVAEEYEQRILSNVRGRHSEKALDQIRRNCVYTLLDLLSLSPSRPDHTTIFANVLRAFKDDSHWENFYALGKYEEKCQNWKEAKQQYEKALLSIKEDYKLNHSKGQWARQISDLENSIERCSKR